MTEALSINNPRPRAEAYSKRMVNLQLMAGCLLFIALVFQLVVRLQVLQVSYSLASTKTQALEADKQLRNIRLDFSKALSPEALLEKSNYRLELKRPEIENLRAINFN